MTKKQHNYFRKGKMKKTVVLLFLALELAFTVKSIDINGGFNKSDKAGNILLWSIHKYKSYGKASLVKDNINGGDCVKLSSSNKNCRSFFFCNKKIEAQKGDTINLNLKVRGTGYFFPGFFIYNAKKQWQTTALGKGKRINSDNWTSFTSSVAIKNPSAQYVNVLIAFEPGSKIFIDDVEVHLKTPDKLELKSANGKKETRIISLSQYNPGVYEFTFLGTGKGNVIVQHTLKRILPLGDSEHNYSFIFEIKKQNSQELSIAVSNNSEVNIKNLKISMVDKKMKEAWNRQQEVFLQLGYIPSHLSVQRKAPQINESKNSKIAEIPKFMREKIIFDGSDYDSAWVAEPDKVREFFVERGFKVLSAENIRNWMLDKINTNSAYGTVCIFSQGCLPATVLRPEKETKQRWFDQSSLLHSVFLRYLEAGGRVVHLGDKTLYYGQEKGGPIMAIPIASIMGLGAKRITYGYSGHTSLTGAGKQWGLSRNYPPVRPVDSTGVTITFCGSLKNNVSQVFLKTVNPQYPLSGLLSFPLFVKKDDQRLLEDVYRLSLYLGKIIPTPNVPARKISKPELAIKIRTAENSVRTAFMRGEKFNIQLSGDNKFNDKIISLKLTTLGNKTILLKKTRFHNGQASFAQLDTAGLAAGDYRLKISAPGLKLIEKDIYIRQFYINPFLFAIRARLSTKWDIAKNLIQKLKQHNLQLAAPYINQHSLRAGISVALQRSGRAGYPDSQPGNTDKQFHILDSSGKGIPSVWAPNNYYVGLIHKTVNRKRYQALAKILSDAVKYPNYYPLVDTNDDFSQLYRMDWSDAAVKGFKTKTGLEAPRLKNKKPPLPAKGIVSDNDPWFSWYVYTLFDVCGAYNEVLRKAKDSVISWGRISVCPGGMQIPLWYYGQYPPAQFGQRRLDCISYYYYPMYWQPSLAITYMNEISRMNNADLPLLCTTDAYKINERSYTWNSFYQHLAGGCNGLIYYSYVDAYANVPKAFSELKRLGEIIKKFGPMFYKMRPAQHKVGLLLPLVQASCHRLYFLSAFFAYANLVGAHVDVKPICREEILNHCARNYDVILLWNVDWISESVARKLENYCRAGGKVYLDSSCEIKLKGARKLDFDIALGNIASPKYNHKDARTGRPGITDYLIRKRVDLIKKKLPKLAGYPYDSDSRQLCVRPFQNDGVTYLWLMNIHTTGEYEFLHKYQGAHLRVKDNKRVEEYLSKRGVYDKKFSAKVILPKGRFTICDVLAGKIITPEENAEGKFEFNAHMKRLGGQLIGLYPDRTAQLEITVSKVGVKFKIICKLLDASMKPVSGLLPMEIKVFCPNGEEAKVYHKYDVAEKGIVSFEFQPAVNEPKGTWRIQFKDMVFNIEKSVKIYTAS